MADLPSRLSPSSASTYRQCPQKFYYSRIERLPDKTSKEGVRGSIVHAILERLFRLPAERRNLTEARIIGHAIWSELVSGESDIFTKAGHDQVDPFAALELSDQDRDAMFDWTWECICRYFQMENPAEVQALHLELAIDGFLGGVMYTGYIDRRAKSRSGRTAVDDYKTGRKPWGQDREDKAFDQLADYAAMLDRIGMRPDVLRLYYLWPKVVLQRSVTDDMLASAHLRAAETWFGIVGDYDAGHWEPRPSKLCDWCAFKSICPAFDHPEQPATPAILSA